MAPEKHDEHIEACTRIFPTWSWIAGILAGLMLTIGGLAWAGSERLTKVDNSIQIMQTDVDKLKSIDIKLDLLLERLK